MVLLAMVAGLLVTGGDDQSPAAITYAEEQFDKGTSEAVKSSNASGGSGVTFDDGGSIESANPAAQAMFGYSANELVRQSVKILMPVLNKMPLESVAAHLFAHGVARAGSGDDADELT